MDDVLKSFAENGPWAVAAAFLLHTVIKAWASDRAQLNELMTSFRDTLAGLKGAVEDLRSEIRLVSEKGVKDE